MKIIHFLLIFFVIFITVSCEKAIVSQKTTDFPSADKDPIQEKLFNEEKIVIVKDSGKFILTPVAEYSISARVVSKRSYSRKWTAKLSPFDLALVWGELADMETDKFISYSQKNRWYYYKYSQDCPIDKNYIIAHSSNNHIIPSTYNLSLALKEIKKNDNIEISGYLVKVSGFVGKQKISWGTSMRRTDSGDRSCELIYAKMIRINDKIFR